MRHFKLPFTLVVTIVIWLSASAQDFSNKGKEFWVGYGYHQGMTTGSIQEMVLYFATDQVTTVTVSIPGLGYSKTYPNIPANTVFTSNPVPKTSPDARLTGESLMPEDKGIHITSDQPIVAYAHIYNSSVSGATILLPTNTLGRDYYSINYTNLSNFPEANCWFYVVACDTGTTTVEITPSANTINHPAGVPFTISMQQGQVFNVMGRLTGVSNGTYSGVDLTGSRIRSISSGTSGCKRIAVFSGSGRISISCDGLQSSSDNYMVQAFPQNAWGKKFLTVNTGGKMTKNVYRICVSDPSTIVSVNGASITYALQNSFYYEIPATAAPQKIEADKPITVAQYITSQDECGNGSPGDPEVIYLSPVEQNISKVLWNATSNFAITQHYFNVIIPNSGTAISSFKLDGNALSSSLFVAHPQDANYAYLIQPVGAGQHIIQSDSGFNAIAYGYGNQESYGYNAGTYLKDLNQFISIHNKYATVNFPTACKSSPFYFSMTFPYQPSQIVWNFFGLFPNVTLNSPLYDSTWVANGRQLYRYKLPDPYTVTASGTYAVQVLAQNSSSGCSGDQEINYDLQVIDRPLTNFSFTNNGCISEPVNFLGTVNANGRTIVTQSWNFGDGSFSSVQNPSHLYASSNSYTVKYSVITDIGCASDTTAKEVPVSEPPVAKFDITTPLCINNLIEFKDLSTTTSTIVKWYWDFGDGTTLLANSNANQTHKYTSGVGPFTVSLKVELSTGCQSTVFSKTLTLQQIPAASFLFGSACLPNATLQFTDQSGSNDPAHPQVTYQWDFGDGGTSTISSPSHIFTSAGPFNVSLTVTNFWGCTNTATKNVNTIFAQPLAAFSAPAEVCNGSSINFTDQSTAAGTSIAQWLWDFGDGTTSAQRNPTKVYAAANNYSVKLTVTSAVGCISTVATKNIVVNSSPTANFSISAPNCISQNITFTDGSIANAGSIIKWTWNSGEGSSSIFASNTPFTHTYSATGSYNATLEVETDKGCVSTIFTKQVLINVLPAAKFGLPESCLNDPFSQFTDSSSISDGTQNQFTYLWNFGDANANAANPNTSPSKNPQHKYTATGSYNVTETVTSNNGCSASTTKTFFVNGSVPIPSFSLANASVCSGSKIDLAENSTVNPGSVVKVEIYWDYTNDPTIKMIDEDPVAGKLYSHTYPEFASPASKTATIKYIVYSGQTCLQSIDKVITLLATPTIKFDSIAGVCKDMPAFQITTASVVNGLTGTGSFSGRGVSSSGLFNPAVANDGVNTIRFTYNANNGCSNYEDQTVEVYPVPTANAGPDKFVLEGGVATLTPAVNANYPVRYLWTPPTWLDNPESPTPKSTPLSDISYTLTVTSDRGCHSSDEVLVKILKAPLIPNIFSPNGDGIHDRWEIAYLASYLGCTVDIYNRYGQLIYHSIGYDKPWDGTVNGKQVPVGTYYYIIDPKNGRKKMSGYVDVIR